MAAKPTPGGSDGTYGTELNAFLDISLAADGKVKDGAVFSTSAAPSVDAGVANKKYVDDQNVAHSGQPKAWGRFTAAGVAKDTYNVTSTAKTDTGKYTITWDTNFADTNYAVIISNGGSFHISRVTIYNVGTCLVEVKNVSAVLADAGCDFVAFGTQ